MTGKAAAALTLARAEALTDPGAAAARATDVLDRIPPARLRSTSRQRLTALDAVLATASASVVADLRERVRALPAAIDPHGGGSA